MDDFQMAVLHAMNSVQSEPITVGQKMEVVSFGTGFFTKLFRLKRFNANHHKKLAYLVERGWLHMWREKSGRKYFALTPAGKSALEEEKTYAKAGSVFRTGIAWSEWAFEPKYRQDSTIEFQHLSELSVSGEF